jgi:hypothetical protein
MRPMDRPFAVGRRYHERRLDGTRTTAALISPVAMPVATETRSTVFTRRYDARRSEWTSELVEPAPMLAEPPEMPNALDDVLSESRERLMEVDDARCQMSVEVGDREFENSDGLVEHTKRTWCDVEVSKTWRGHTLRSYEGVAQIADVPEVVTRRIAEIESRVACLRRPPLPAPGTANVLLESPVAEVLFHELVGHGSEGGLFHAIGLPFTITANHPRCRGHDDEGVRVGRAVLVGEGSTARTTDRETAGGASPSGLAQAGFHSGAPHRRCTHMTVEPLETTPAPQTGEAVITCRDIVSAQLWGDCAVIRIGDARITDRDGLRAVETFDLVLSLADLQRCLTAVGPAADKPRGGRCTRYGDTLPTVTRAPSLVLSEVCLHAA